jgi:predicted protein tyrosine phosphatase
MIQVADRIYVGGESDCQRGTEGLVVIHACKDPCHKRAVGYTDNLAHHHPKFIAKEDPFDLYLNIIDPREPRFQKDTFIEFLRFAKKHYDKGASLLIHCNLGASRSPSLALLFLAKYLGKLPDDTFGTARAAFKLMYLGYQPGPGIYKYLTDNWQSLGDF